MRGTVGKLIIPPPGRTPGVSEMLRVARGIRFPYRRAGKVTLPGYSSPEASANYRRGRARAVQGLQ
jgi:hypothetical protein